MDRGGTSNRWCAIRAQGRRALLSRGWADLALIDDQDDCFTVGEVNHCSTRSADKGQRLLHFRSQLKA